MTYVQNNKGITLIELILYVAIASTMLFVIILFSGVVLESRIKNQSIVEVEAQGIFVMNTITHTVRNAESITSPSPGESTTTLELSFTEAGQDPTEFSLLGSTLVISEDGSASIPLTNGQVEVSNLSFENLSRADTPGLVRISFTLSRVNPEGRQEYVYGKTFVTSVSLRTP